MINWNQVEELRDAVGAEEFGELVEVFLEEVESVLYQIDETQTATELEAQLHFLKGSALNLGFSDFSDLCQLGETAAKAGSLVEVDRAEIVKSYNDTKAIFLVEIDKRYAA